MTSRPPRFAELLLRLRIDPQDRDDLLGDLAELHARRVRESGAHRAWLAYWHEALALLWHAGPPRPVSRSRRSRAGSGLAHDFRSAVRIHIRHPAQTVVAIVTLGVGLGMTTSVLSAARALVFDRLPTPAPETVVRIEESERGTLRGALSEPDVLAWRAARHIFSEVAAYSTAARALTGLGAAERLQMAEVDEEFFPLFRVQPLAGRLITADDLKPGPERAVVLGERFWRTRFGGDPTAIGRLISLDHVPHRIVGVVSDAFTYPEGTRLWASMRITPVFRDRRFHLLTAVGRISGDMTLARAQQAAATVAAEIARRDPAVHGNRSAVIVPLQAHLTRDVRAPMHFLLLAAAMVLLVACINVSGIVLTRTADRWRELGMRAAIGATRLQLVRLIAVEASALTAIAGSLGALIAYGATGVIRKVAPGDLNGRERIVVDVELLGWCMLSAAAAALLTAVLPAVRVARMNVLDAIRDAGRTMTSRRFGRHAMVTLQIGVAVALLICGLLLVRSFEQLTRVDPGFHADRTVMTPVRLPLQKYPRREQYKPVLDDLLSRVAKIEGVAAAAYAFVLPLSPGGLEVQVRAAEGVTRQPVQVLLNMVTAGYFRTMQIALVRGRSFSDDDTNGATPVCIVSERLARLTWGRSDVVGEWLHGGSPGERWQIVGVAADVKDRDLAADSRPALYRPFSQFPSNFVTLVARADDADRLIPVIRATISSVDPDIPVDAIASLQTLVETALARSRFIAALVGVFSVVAVAIAVTGLYAAVGYTVRVRRREIGLRLALGATRAMVVGHVARDIALILCAGLALGSGASLAGARLIRQALFNVATWDAASFIAAAVLVIAAGAFASVGALRAAAATDPARTLQLG